MWTDRLAANHAELSADGRYARTRSSLAELEREVDARPLGDPDRSRIEEALALMFGLHLGQKDRPDGQPYVNHVLNVALAVARAAPGGGPDPIIAALLHDSVEDQAEKLVAGAGSTGAGPIAELALQQIRARFGDRVAALVGALTNPDFDSLVADRRAGGDARSDDDLYLELYRDHFRQILDGDPEAFLIKLADFSDNALRVGELPHGPKRTWLQRKYGPVIGMVIRALDAGVASEQLPATARSGLIERLTTVYVRDYGGAVG